MCINVGPRVLSWARYGSYRLVGLVGQVLYNGSGMTTGRPAKL
jgi:hypothetical protein